MLYESHENWKYTKNETKLFNVFWIYLHFMPKLYLLFQVKPTPLSYIASFYSILIV